jgi:hypothetical protein
VFGAFVTGTWDSMGKYSGTGESFLFTLSPYFKVRGALPVARSLSLSLSICQRDLHQVVSLPPFLSLMYFVCFIG